MSRSIRSVARGDEGATTLEYGIMLVLALVALSVLLVFGATGNLV
jgi:Flp pilus assembly pilin Flp